VSGAYVERQTIQLPTEKKDKIRNNQSPRKYYTENKRLNQINPQHITGEELRCLLSSRLYIGDSFFRERFQAARTNTDDIS